MGLVRPWRVAVQFYDHAKGELVDRTDPVCYCAAESDPQYHRLIIHISPRHPGWQERETHGLDSTLRHECGHGVTSPLTRFAAQIIEQFVPTPDARAALQKQLDDTDDVVVNRIAEFPVWDQIGGA